MCSPALCVAGVRRTLPAASFFTAYRMVALKADEIVERVTIPFASSTRQFTRSYKQARRSAASHILLQRVACKRLFLLPSFGVQT